MKKLKIKSEDKEIKIPIHSPLKEIERICAREGMTLEDVRSDKKFTEISNVRSTIWKELKSRGFKRSMIARLINKAPNTLTNYEKKWK